MRFLLLNAKAASSALVRSLELNNNYLKGWLPEEWTTFRGLDVLTLSNNFIIGTLPGGWSALHNLTVL